MLTKEDYEECMSTARYKTLKANATNPCYYQGVAYKNAIMNKYTQNKMYARKLSLLQYYVSTPSPAYEKSLSDINLSVLTKNQAMVIQAFLEYGNLVKAAQALSRNYDTVKALYRQAVLRIREKGICA